MGSRDPSQEELAAEEIQLSADIFIHPSQLSRWIMLNSRLIWIISANRVVEQALCASCTVTAPMIFGLGGGSTVSCS